MITPLVIYTQKDFYLNEEINDNIGLFKSAGLIVFWRNQDIQLKISNDDDKIYPKLLTLDQLMGSFAVLTLGCVVSSIIFLVEIFFEKRNCLKKQSINP